DAFCIAEGFREGAADSNAGVLDGVVGVDMEVAGGIEREVEDAVAAELVEEVVEHADAGPDVRDAAAIEVKRDVDRGLAGLATIGCDAGRWGEIHLKFPSP